MTVVMHIITGLNTGGAERALCNVIQGGLAERFQTVVVSLTDGGRYGPMLEEFGVPVHCLGMKRGLTSFSALWCLRKVVRKYHPDIVQGWMYHGNLAARLAITLAAGRPAVVWNVRHSLYNLADEKPLTQQVIRSNHWLSSRIDSIVYNSQASRRQHEAFGFAGSRGKIIPNGFDVVGLRPEPGTGKSIRQELSIPEDALVIGHVARFHPMKDHASFLRAAVRVASAVPAARFLVVGREVSPRHPTLAGIVPPELLERFVFPGEHSDVPRLMQSMDVFCLSSWSEAFPNVLGEAMASGVACVTTDVGDCADIVRDTGIVVPPSDSEALARGLMEMLDKPSKERVALCRAAMERVECHYGLDSVVAQYTNLYKTLAK